MRSTDGPSSAGASDDRLAPFDPFEALTWRFKPAGMAPERVRTFAPLTLAIVVAMHAAFFLLLDGWSEPDQASPSAVAIEVVMLDSEPPPMVPPPVPIAQNEKPQTIPVQRAVPVSRTPRAPSPKPPAETEAVFLPADVPSSARIFSVDGSIVDLADQIKNLDQRASAKATFEYQIAGITEAETAFQLPQAIEVNVTRFDRHWKPTANLVDELLERAVKASTLAVSIPVPGLPGYRFGCAIVVVAATGSCGLSEPSKLVYDIDDPNTLSAEEAKACEILWDRITDPSSQAVHRRDRKLYDLGCRLPLATGAAVRSDRQGFPTTQEIRQEMRQ